jgi:hypothetical protein
VSASFGLAVVAGLEHNGVKVLYPLGDTWLTRGNGQTSNYQGMIWHHTATGYSNTAPAVLWNGRPDLSGPLCNTSGNADGSVSMIAAHPANHAGASGGKSMGPLPVTSTFNKLVWGHEIVYPGDKPMTAAQYRTMQILGGVVSGILRRPTAEWCRGHAETSITGKWDPGYAPSKTIDLAAARRDTWAALNTTTTGGTTMAIRDEVWQALIPDLYTAKADDNLPAFAALGWANAHAAFARTAAESAAAGVARIEARLASSVNTPVAGPATLSDADVQRIAAAVVKLLGAKASV